MARISGVDGRSERGGGSRVAKAAAALAALFAGGHGAGADSLPAFGVPIFTPGDASYEEALVGIPSTGIVNDSGTAVGNMFKSGSQRALRWDASGNPANVVELGNIGSSSFGSTATFAAAINVSGTAVGYGLKALPGGSNLGTRAARWDASAGTTATELGHLGTDAFGGTTSEARAVNAVGTAVGTAILYDRFGQNLGTRAVRWNAGEVTANELRPLGTSRGGVTTSSAYAVNSAGAVVGVALKYDSAGQPHGLRAVRWSPTGSPTELGNLGTTFENTNSVAYAVNAAGTAVGYAEKHIAGHGSIGTRAARWDAGAASAIELSALGTDPYGDTDASAVAINDSGVAVGWASKFDPLGKLVGRRSVRWDANGAANELGNLGTNSSHSTLSEAFDVDQSGAAVGYANAYTSDGVGGSAHAVYWPADSAAAVDLNSLIDPVSGWTLTRAFGISDTGGWIAGLALYDPDGMGGVQAYGRLFLIQVPEPAWAGVLPFLALTMRRRGRT